MLKKSDAKPQDFDIITFIGHSEKCKSKSKLDKKKPKKQKRHKTQKNRLAVTRNQGRGEWLATKKMQTETFGDAGSFPYDTRVIDTGLYSLVRKHRTACSEE